MTLKFEVDRISLLPYALTYYNHFFAITELYIREYNALMIATTFPNPARCFDVCRYIRYAEKKLEDVTNFDTVMTFVTVLNDPRKDGLLDDAKMETIRRISAAGFTYKDVTMEGNTAGVIGLTRDHCVVNYKELISKGSKVAALGFQFLNKLIDVIMKYSKNKIPIFDKDGKFIKANNFQGNPTRFKAMQTAFTEYWKEKKMDKELKAFQKELAEFREMPLITGYICGNGLCKKITPDAEVFMPKTRFGECGNCNRVYYCNEDCQDKDWMVHRTMCKQIALDSAPPYSYTAYGFRFIYITPERIRGRSTGRHTSTKEEVNALQSTIDSVEAFGFIDDNSEKEILMNN